MATVNPVWASFVSEQMEEWLEWLRNIHINSYLELSERFMALHPYYIPTESDSPAPLFEKLMVNFDFINSLSDKGALVWANSNFLDFVDALRPYGRIYPEIRMVVDFFDQYILWFKRVYQFLRANLILHLRESGRSI